MRGSVAALALVATAALASACAAISGLGDLAPSGDDGSAAASDGDVESGDDATTTGDDGSVGGGGGGGGGGGRDGGDARAADGGVLAACSGHPGPVGVDVGPFCIDSTEVTKAQYAAFLAATGGGDAGGLPAVCGPQNGPAGGGGRTPRCNYDGTAPTSSDPVSCVTWCDALAYCTWAGKRLCGAVAGGGETAWSTVDSPAFDEWAYACTHAGANAYPYGSAYQSGRCNDGNSGNTGAIATGTSTCIGGFPGIWDMSGNVGEWSNSCDAGTTNTTCAVRGGSYTTTDTTQLACGHNALGRTGSLAVVGFRCCW